jgi:hypothetical protein
MSPMLLHRPRPQTNTTCLGTCSQRLNWGGATVTLKICLPRRRLLYCGSNRLKQVPRQVIFIGWVDRAGSSKRRSSKDLRPRVFPIQYEARFAANVGRCISITWYPQVHSELHCPSW